VKKMPVFIGKYYTQFDSIHLYDTICPGETKNFYGQLLSTSGMYDTVFPNQYGCDSTILLHLKVAQAPEAAGAVVGVANVCSGQTGVVYSIPTILYAASYSWTLPPGATITSGYGTNSILVNFPNNISTGSFAVYGANQCGVGNASASYEVTINPPLSGQDTLHNLTVVANQDECRSAQTITTGGTGNPLLVQSGGEIELIASQKITLKPSTKVLPGGYLHAFITTLCARCAAQQQASDIVFSNVQSDRFTLNWTDGSGTSRVVLIKQDSAGTPAPVNNATYNASPAFGSGSQIGATGWYCVFNGTAHASGVVVTNLLANTKYRVMVCEFTGDLGSEQYNTSTANNNPNNQKTCQLTVPTISGPTVLCSGSTQVNYATESGMTGYTWDISPGGTLVSGQGTNNIAVIWNTPGAQTVSVIYTSPTGCVALTPSTLNVTVNSTPAAAGSITGPTAVCTGSSGVVYSVPAVQFATSYTWNLPFGASIVSGAGTNAITVNFQSFASSGNISVYATNSCSNGLPSEILHVNIYPQFTGQAVLQNITINSSQNMCLTAQTITTGGSGTSFLVQNGGQITLIASQYIRFLPATTVQSGGYLHGTINTQCIPCGLQQATNIVFSNVLTNGVTTNWTDGSGAKRIVFIKQDSLGTSVPVNNTTYSANPVFGSGSQIGTSGWYCVFNGTTHSPGVTISNLLANTKYRVMVCEYNGSPGTEQYNISSASNNPKNIKTCVIVVPAITGPVSACAGSTNIIYSTEPGMTNYAWSISSGGSINSGSSTNSIAVTWNTIGPQSVSVSYVNANGCAASIPTTKPVTVQTRPTPTITGLSSICEGTTGVSYTTETGMTGYSWTVSSGGTITSGSGTSAIAVTWNSPGAQTVSVNYTNENLCSALSPANKNVSVYARPSPTITGSDTVCAGTSEIIYSTESGMTDYSWTISSGGEITAGAGTSSVTVNWYSAGSQTVTAAYANANGCLPVTPANKTVTVNSRPVPSIDGNTSVCIGPTETFYTTETGMSGYSWIVSAGGTITSGNGASAIAVTWNTPGLQAVSVNYTNAEGCAALAPTNKNITVYARPTPTIAGLTAACEGATGVSYTTETAMNGYSWSISSGGNITAGSGTNSITVTWQSSGSQNVSVTYTDINGCAPASPAVKNVMINPRPVPSITGDSVVCLGAAGNTYSTEAGMTGYTWNVSAGGNVTAGAGTNALTVAWTTIGLQTVSVSYTSAAGCIAIHPTDYNVNVLTLPGNAGTITGPSSVCVGSTGVQYATTPVSGATSYEWSLPLGVTIASGSGTNSITVNFPGFTSSGYISVIGKNRCGNGAASQAMMVTSYALPSGQANLENIVITGTQDECLTAQTIITAGNGTNFLVQSGGRIKLIASQDIHLLPITIVQPNGYLRAMITSNCLPCSSLKIAIADSLNHAETDAHQFIPDAEDQFFRIYPNPTTGKFTIEIATMNNFPVTEIKVFGMLGEIVLTDKMVGITKKQLTFESQPSGIYMVVVMLDGQVGTAKIIRMR
jgi:hypothetical protein